jgi:hypothetical protein
MAVFSCWKPETVEYWKRENEKLQLQYLKQNFIKLLELVNKCKITTSKDENKTDQN